MASLCSSAFLLASEILVRAFNTSTYLYLIADTASLRDAHLVAHFFF